MLRQERLQTVTFSDSVLFGHMCIVRESCTYWLILTLPSSSLLRYLHLFVTKHILLRLLHDPTPILLELPRTNTSFEDLIKLF
jgi:hypothetical protein